MLYFSPSQVGLGIDDSRERARQMVFWQLGEGGAASDSD